MSLSAFQFAARDRHSPPAQAMYDLGGAGGLARQKRVADDDDDDDDDDEVGHALPPTHASQALLSNHCTERHGQHTQAPGEGDPNYDAADPAMAKPKKSPKKPEPEYAEAREPPKKAAKPKVPEPVFNVAEEEDDGVCADCTVLLDGVMHGDATCGCMCCVGRCVVDVCATRPT